MLDTLSKAALYCPPFELCGNTFSATLFGKPENNSLSQLNDPVKGPALGRRLEAELLSRRVGKALAPSPVQFTDRIIDPKELTTKVSVGAHALYRNPEEPADGVPLEAGEAYVISPAGCPITLMVRGDTAFALHTGRFCLVDPHWAEHGICKEGRANTSICFTALNLLRAHSERPNKETRVKVFWSIPPRNFKHDLDDPKYQHINKGFYHKVRSRWGERCVPRRDNIFYPDLPQLIRAQCMEAGVPEENIDLSHAYMSATNPDVWMDGTAGAGRNVVILARHS